eukprot:TRINITY_DN108084_c0_g1_i1.p1 TRINITY_DN108084_c0_g1~~TRINITY_DN108084_c0_g1_i1.p1  ORF type:complete len:455 (+),score=78.03 TRINITY_DN108084_c0_g1_i1:80-1444(+)
MARLFIFAALVTSTWAADATAETEQYIEPEETLYWSPGAGAVPPFDAPRLTDLTRQEFDDLIMDGKVFVVPGLSHDWPLRKWDCDFFKHDPEFKKAAMNHQYAARGGRDTTLGDDWQSDKTASGANNDSAPQVAPFYWGIKDVQYERRPGWKQSMLKRVAQSCKVPPFMDASTAGSFARTPEFWFGTGSAGAKAHMDSHVQATLSLQIAGTKRWRLMPLRKRRAPFLAMLYSDGQPYENPEGWDPLFDITLQPGDGLFFPPGMIHETKNTGDVCTSSVTFQFNVPFAARFYRRFFPRVRQTADIGESWIIIRAWARLGMSGDKKGKGVPYRDAMQDKKLEPHFKKLDSNHDGFVSRGELDTFGMRDAGDAIGWHDTNNDALISLQEFREGFAFWSDITFRTISMTPKEWKKYQHFGTIENLEDLPPQLSSQMRKASLQQEAQLMAAESSQKAEL